MNIKKHITIEGDQIMNKHEKLCSIEGLLFIGGQITSRIEANIVKKEMPIGTVKVIPPKAIQNGRIEHSELYELGYKIEPDEKKLTQEGDIIVKLSTPYDVAYITAKDVGLLVTSFCILIRNNNQCVSSEFLTAFMNSGIYRTQVLNKVSGAAVPMLTMGKIKDVEIKVMPLEEQRQVAEYYNLIRKKELAMNRIIELEKEKIDAILGGKQNG